MVVHSNRLIRDDEGDERRSRSRSGGSITRYEYEQDGSRKVIIRSNYPANIKVVRSESSLDDPPHRTIRTPPKEVRVDPISRAMR